MKVALHPLFVLFVAVTLWAGFGLYVLMAVIAVLIHEASHAIAANHFGVRAKKLTLLPFGAQVNIECAFLPRRQRNVILLAGPLGNVVAALVASSFLWAMPEMFGVLELFIVANAVTAALNLLPIYPMDCGKILKTPKIFSSIFFGIALFVGCFVWFNWALIVLAVFMLFSVNIEGRTELTSKLCKVGNAKKGAVREVAVRSDMTIFAVYKMVSHRAFTKFVITDRGNRAFYESELEHLLMSHELDTRLLDIYNLDNGKI